MAIAKSSRRVEGPRSGSGRLRSEGVVVPPAQIEKLHRALEKAIVGEVRFSMGDRALYATDASNYRQIPYGVVLPKSAEDVVATVRICNAHDVPVTPRGGGTSLAGQTCNTSVIIDFSKYMHRVISLDPEKRLAVVEPGCILDHLRGKAEKHGLTFGPDPATHERNTLGGMIGNDSCGVHSVMAGRTADNVHSLDVLTYDGLRMTIGPTSPSELNAVLAAGGRRAEIYRRMRDFWARHGAKFEKVYPQIPRRVSGYENLDQLSSDKGMNVARALTGTEATCLIVLRATLHLVPSPRCRALAIVGFSDVFAAADAVPDALETKPIGLEGMDQLLTEYMKKKHFKLSDLKVLPKGCGWLIAEFGGDTIAEATEKARALATKMESRGHACNVVSDKDKQQEVWDVREAGLAVTAHVPGERPTWPGWEDSAVRPDQLGDYLRELKALFHKHGYEASVYGHFGDGLIHCRVDFDLSTEQGLKIWQAFLEEAADLVVKYGGSLSGEHGDGEARGALLERMYGAELMAAQREFRAIWDPRQRMNPGKILDPYPVTGNLRVGPSYKPPEIKGLFAYPEDGGSFTKATLRCVGVGKCRRRETKGGVMCPSYLGTDEEKHSTRGRARLLFEMLRGDALADRFANEAVEDALDLCLACKGCKHDCPVEVDMASYKADFRARHYEKKRRPRAAYSMGQIQRWARVAAVAPELTNLALRAPGLSALTKWAAGISQTRTMPRFAWQTFRDWHRRQARRNGGERVILWPDTFNNYFRTGTAIAATRLLEQCGFEVHIPGQPLCCGRPLYDWGWIDQAKSLWRTTLNSMRNDIRAGVPVIGLEPACTSAFRDELPNLFPGDPQAAALSRQTRLLSEFLKDRGISPPVPQSRAPLLVQYHCHHHAVLDKSAETDLLKSLPVHVDILDKGCCGMAGSFGFETNKAAVSRTIAERGILPVIRMANADATILADGFSCREQIEQLTGRRTLHLAEYLMQPR
ncbi:MAG TPA: FAD-binding and (Fe-S)-binding domain-containing protein [Rhizomicrobium sp.]|jgi:FAD/FMN-containing dehydrogenase/Fe-S oxidoreductase|nr:FAD-binding and (Fe-S)-binding domain-containing protein [Rhizomicrobium sp.]